MSTTERRRRRSDLITEALTYQLHACREDGGMHAMVVADAADGLALASSGDAQACDEVATSMVHVAARTDRFAGTLYRGGRHWEVQMARVSVDGSPLVVCAIGGSAADRHRQIARGAKGALRILGAA